MTRDDPFADLSLTSSKTEIVDRLNTVLTRTESADRETLLAVSLHTLTFLDRIIAEGETTAPDDPALTEIRNLRAIYRAQLGDGLVATRPRANLN